MKKIIFLSFLLVSIISYSQDYTQKLKSDVVKIQNGKLVMDDFTLVKVTGKNLQVKFHSEAPTNDFISRDNFIYFSSEVLNELLNQFTDADPKAETENLDEITGTADVTINCYMSKTGVQIESITPTGTEKNMEKWSELF